ncbi:MAG: M56 family metallopeptidase [Acidimicrobiia bacterium]|nr:M56 family metallopeptidase [Acidimicrobiia bacterium]
MRLDDLNELTSILPAWVPWAGPSIALATLVFVSLVVMVVLVQGAFRTASRAETWTERARSVHVARTGAAIAVLLLPAVGVVAATAFVGPLAAVPRPFVMGVLGVVGVVTAILQSSVVDRYVHGPSDAGLLRSAFGVVISYSPLLALIVLGWFAPSDLISWPMLPWAVVVLVVVYAWLRIPLLMMRTPLARAADDRTSTIVERAAESLSMDVELVLEFRTRQPNAFAFPWLGVVAFTTGLLDALDDEELEAITHHELAHLSESAGLTRLRQAQILALTPIVAARPLFGTFGVVGPVAAVLCFVAVTVIARRRALAAEHASDTAAVESIHRSEVYARALEKTYRIGLIPAVLRRATHGQLHERLLAAGVEPDFDPPAPPSRVRGLAALLAGVVVLAGAWFSPWLAYIMAGSDSLVPTHLAAALPIYGSDPLVSLAFEAELEERWGDAAILYDAAADGRPAEALLRLEAVRSWAYAGDCVRAERSADSLDRVTRIDDLRYAEELIDWCDLTGGLPTSG